MFLWDSLWINANEWTLQTSKIKGNGVGDGDVC